MSALRLAFEHCVRLCGLWVLYGEPGTLEPVLNAEEPDRENMLGLQVVQVRVTTWSIVKR